MAETAAHRTLPADDPRNPSYYEDRAGYSKRDLAWYHNKNDRGENTMMNYSKENFVSGWNMECGQFYKIRKALALEVLRRGLPQLALKSIQAQFEIYEVMEWLERLLNKNGRLSVVPAYWREHSKKDFVVRIVAWVKKYKMRLEGGDIVNFSQKAKWKWGPHRQSEEFKGIFQLQHLKIVIQVPEDDMTIPVRDIIDIKKFGFSYLDVDVKKIKFSLLQQAMEKKKHSPYKATTYYVAYVHPDHDDDEITEINDDDSLHLALYALRKHMDDKVHFKMIKRTAELGLNVNGKRDASRDDIAPRSSGSRGSKRGKLTDVA